MNEQMRKIRDELAKEYSLRKFPVQNIQTTKDFTQDINFARRQTYCQSYQDGFDAAVKEYEPMIEKLVEALRKSSHGECIERHYTFKCKCQRCEAIAKYEEWRKGDSQE